MPTVMNDYPGGSHIVVCFFLCSPHGRLNISSQAQNPYPISSILLSLGLLCNISDPSFFLLLDV